MKTVTSRSFARAGFLGNPSDGYFGKTISFSFSNYCVELRLTESERLRFIPSAVDDADFASPNDLVRDLRLYGYYGGIRMLKAVAKLFFEYCRDHGLAIPEVNFTAEYRINIPRLVGLSGSSAICSAMLKALCAFYGVRIVEHAEAGDSMTIPLEDCPTICLAAERDELGIACGLQDRVIQMYNGIVYMDFKRELVEKTGHGYYERLWPMGAIKDPSQLHLYVAFDPNRAEESGKAHKHVFSKFQHHNADVVAAMSEFADIAEHGRELLVSEVMDDEVRQRLSKLVDDNFNLRDRIFNVAEENRRMVMTARSSGASAKFAGSGGAIVGVYADDQQFKRLQAALADIGCTTLRPRIATSADEAIAADAQGWRNS